MAMAYVSLACTFYSFILDTSYLPGILFWLLDSLAISALALYFSDNELLFRWIWHGILTKALADKKWAEAHSREITNHLSSILEIEESDKFIYEPSAKAPEDEDVIFPSINDEQSIEIYYQPDVCCGCIKTGENFLDINAHRVTAALIHDCYPCFCGNITYLTQWFQSIPAVYFTTRFPFYLCTFYTVISCITCNICLIPIQLFVQCRRKALLELGTQRSWVVFPVHILHIPYVRNILVRAIGAQTHQTITV